MILDKFNMVNMEGIDVVYSQNISVVGLYQRLVESIALCRYSTLYNWKFAEINIPPTPVELVHENGVVTINEAISVDSDDVVHIQSLEPILEALSVSENGLYLPPEGNAGFSQVDVEVPLTTKSITENGTYNASDDSAAGYSSVTVSVSGNVPALPLISSENIVLVEENKGTYDGVSQVQWGDLVLAGSGITPHLDAVRFPQTGYAYYDLGADNHSFTCYFVGNVYRVPQFGASNNLRIISSAYAESSGNTVEFCDKNRSVMWGGYAHDMLTSIPVYINHVYSISFDGGTKEAKFYLDGTMLGSWTANNADRKIEFTNQDGFADQSFVVNCPMDVYYIAIVDGVDDQATVISNQQVLINAYGIG